VSAACARPLLPIPIKKSNSPGQRVDMYVVTP
jgi:hypothetical protein